MSVKNVVIISGGMTPVDKILLDTLGDTKHEYEIFELIESGTSGTVTTPANGTIVMDQYPGAADCLAVKVDPTTERPIDETAKELDGTVITGTLDSSGNYTISGSPSSYPIALIFQIQLAERYKEAELNNSIIINETELLISSRVSYDNSLSLLSSIDVQSAIDEMRTIPTRYHGVITLPTITDNTDGTVSIGAGSCNFSVVADGDGAIVRLSTPAADPVSLIDGVTNYVYADYNSGTPTINVAVTPNDFLSDGRLVPLFRIIREGTDLHILDYDAYGLGLSDKMFFKDVALRAFERSSGLVLSTAATRISTVSAGSAWFGVQLYTLDANVSGTSGELEYYYLVAGVWNKSTVTAYDSIYYSDGTDRQSLGVSKYVAKYFYRGVETDNHVYYISGNQKNSVSEAMAEAVPVAPSVITSHSIYVGKVVIQQGATNGIAYPRSWEGSIATSGAVNHNDLANRDAAGSHVAFIPLADSATAFKFFKAGGVIPIVNVDTVNNRFEIFGITYPTLRFINTNLTLPDDSIIGRIDFYISDPSAPAPGIAAYIECRANPVDERRGELIFATGTASSASEKMRIDNLGNVLIGDGSLILKYTSDTGSQGIKLGETADGFVFSDYNTYIGIDNDNTSTVNSFNIYHDANKASVLFSVYESGNAVVQGYTKLGSDAPSIKTKKLTGTTGSTEGSTVGATHGLTQSKIIGCQVLVNDSNGNDVLPGYNDGIEVRYGSYITSESVNIALSATDSASLISRPYRVLLTYEE